MPQESRSRRSIGYRSFISCEDPRGVAECGTVRKPKIAPTRKFEYGKKHESDAIVEEAESPTSFHLLEVSKGAQKLNNVISSWSAGHSKNNSKDMAQDLLKGALDLGESLAMLSRLQQSPNYMLESKKKQHKKKIGKVWFDDDLEMDENEGAQSHQEHRLSFEEMTRVIRDSRKDASSFTSSSQSSVAHSGNFVFPEPFLSPAASLKKTNKKTKRSNLIAKLMGLEDVSSFSYSNPRKDKGDNKTLKQKKSAFDLDSPIERKHEHDSQKSGWKRKPRLDNVVKTVEYKGVPNAFNSEFSGSKQKWGDADDRPPIVVLRPLRFSCLDLEQPIVPKSRAEVYEDMFVGMRIRNNPLAQTDEGEPLNFNENFGKSVKSKCQVKEAKAKETASLLGNSKSHKKHIVEKNAQQPQKLKTSRGKNMYGDQRYRDEYVEANRIRERESMFQTSDSCRITEDASQIEITVADYVDDDQSSPSETSLLIGNQRNNEDAYMRPNEYGWTDHAKLSQCSGVDIRPIEGGNICSKSEVFDVITAPCVGKVKALLVSNQSFIKSVEEVFDVKVTPDSHQGNDIDHSELSARELLDTANELIGLHGSRRRAHKTISITRYCYSSLDQLLDEVCDEIEDLRRYRKEEGDDCSNDSSSILLLVKRDLRTTGLVGGMWDMGWTSAGSVDEIEEITRGVDELVLDGLIGEILADLNNFMLCSK